MTFLRKHLRRTFAIALLPLSIIPFGLFLVTQGAHGANVRLIGGDTPWPAPTIVVHDAKFKPPPDYGSRAIPVLLYHGIGYKPKGSAPDYYTVTPEAFSQQLALLQHLGYHTISIEQYADWWQHKNVVLPSRPILLTFDDARFDSYRGADKTLAKYHMRATIFVIVGSVEAHNLFYCTWGELHKMQRSGRWDIQFHAYHGHVRIPIDAAGHEGAFYASREYLPHQKRMETKAEYEYRVRYDIETGLKILAQHGYSSRTMAMPFGESNIGYLGTLLHEHFATTFIQSGHSFTPYSSRTDPASIRQELHVNTTVRQLYDYLDGSDPVVIDHKLAACPSYSHMNVELGPYCSKYRVLSNDKVWAAAHPGRLP